MSEFADQMRAHLARYKNERLGVYEDGHWRGNERAYAHILPEGLHRLNILESIRKEFWQFYEANRKSLGLHTDFHHLNSSQAFAFNLLFPWLGMEEDPAPLLSALGFPGLTVVSWAFEHMPDQAERTSVDLFMELSNGSRILVEVKLTEPHFGQCIPEDSHRKKLKSTYTPRLSSIVHAGSLEETTFFLNYQLFRNVSHLELARGDVLLLLLPRANKLTWQEGATFREKHLANHAQGAVRLVGAEDLLTDLASSAEGMSARLTAHSELLAEKYQLRAE